MGLSDYDSTPTSKPSLQLDTECSSILGQMKGQWPPEELEELVSDMKSSRKNFELQLEEAIRLLRIRRARNLDDMSEVIGLRWRPIKLHGYWY